MAKTLTKQQIALALRAEKERESAIKAEKREAAKTARALAAAEKAAKAKAAESERVSRETERAAENAKNALAALRVDYEAGFEDGRPSDDYTFEQFLEENGYNADGTAKVDPDDDTPADDDGKHHYEGPMLALVHARATYAKAPNGNQMCGDDMALICGNYSRDVVVAGLIRALYDAKVLTAHSNPYAHLNPGQQSMNLRNKARGAIKAGKIKTDAIKAALEAAKAK